MVIENDHKAKGRLISNFFKEKGSTHKDIKVKEKETVEIQLTAKTRKGMTSIIMRVDFTPTALKKPTDPRTESITSITPERPSNTWNTTFHQIKNKCHKGKQD